MKIRTVVAALTAVAALAVLAPTLVSSQPGEASVTYDESLLVASDASLQIKDSAGSQRVGFGRNVRVAEGGTVVVGAHQSTTGDETGGAVYVYRAEADGSYSETKLTSGGDQAQQWLGWTVDINKAGVIVSGDPYYDVSLRRHGAIVVFTPNEQGYRRQVLVDDGNGQLGDQENLYFGRQPVIDEEGTIA